ncbi:3-phosphoinositide-dependent protein kinase 1 [Tritrichomonas foetus]|uniref:non-specific serine/threonine protein kinase n=1 Tax=Tritrichomonas foetus TaxID=1144522 RepID=A0A1J4JFT1_9EUKA|nr:3-phosphoinositide-dependent protein kinase 1 [Tritrichomonas foetus]|eukprot:OHS98010.1 3-phosphoinositide-dependent protein kinase 1 [Tritrichomonas foetus]
MSSSSDDYYSDRQARSGPGSYSDSYGRLGQINEGQTPDSNQSSHFQNQGGSQNDNNTESSAKNNAEDKPKQKRRDDFDLGKLLGEGAFGQVLEVIDKETQKHYAMKVLSKAHIVKEKKMQYVKVERDVMSLLNHPNIVKLLLTFQDPGNLYYVIEYAPNGDLQKVLDQYYALDVPSTIVLCGQILLGLAHIHQNRIIHRDLKPENILLDSENRAKITDFGTSKIFSKSDDFFLQRGSFVGSADYVCPETLIETPIGPASDLWSFGCILYTMLVGEPPFKSDSNYATFQKIEKLEYSIPDFVPMHAKDLISKLLVLEPSDRIGYNDFASDYEAIRNHPFFAFVDWDSLPTKSPPAFESFASALQRKQKADAKVNGNANLNGNVNGSVNGSGNVNGTQVADLLMNGEVSVFEGLITKKRRLSSKKRLLVLTNKPRLFYVDMTKKEIKGDIPLNENTTVSIKKGKKWAIKVPGRKYDLIAESCDPSAWKSALDNVLNKH